MALCAILLSWLAVSNRGQREAQRELERVTERLQQLLLSGQFALGLVSLWLALAHLFGQRLESYCRSLCHLSALAFSFRRAYLEKEERAITKSLFQKFLCFV